MRNLSILASLILFSINTAVLGYSFIHPRCRRGQITW